MWLECQEAEEDACWRRAWASGDGVQGKATEALGGFMVALLPGGWLSS